MGSRISNAQSHVPMEGIILFFVCRFFILPKLVVEEPSVACPLWCRGACGERASRSPSANACTKVKAIKLREWERSSSAVCLLYAPYSLLVFFIYFLIDFQ